ncbi:hypothetical protein HCN44_003450 [Aphidius gifuensis]|uniref:Uncharacterized protein n=1 Tax=Aphidius gifuensis TaxID=684658 RepID=A0A835CKU5_APHGI|nr:hypothetical protein HCN44_003450 [Aphidius gifuensis]
MKHLLCVVFHIFILAISVNCYSIHQNLKNVNINPWRDLPLICSMEDPKNISVSCHGVRIIKRVVQELLETAANAPTIELFDGISLIKNNNFNVRNSRTIKDFIHDFLEGKELRMKLQSLLPNSIESSVIDSIPTGGIGSGLPGFGGGKKGDNSFVILAIMMGKMLGMMSFGALGIVAMKALGVSLLALVLSIFLAAKKYSSGSPKSDGEHHVVYAQDIQTSHEKRSVTDENLLPYRGYAEIYGDTPQNLKVQKQ